MHKRLLALVATVAMVLSMFAGIAFAATPAETNVNTDTETLIYAPYTAKEEAYEVTIKGTLTTATGARVKDDIIWALGDQAGVIPAENNGSFSITIDVSALEAKVNDTVELTLTPVNTALYQAATQELAERNQVSFTAPKVTYNSDKTVSVFGYLVDARGKVVDATDLKLAALAAADTALAKGDKHAQALFAAADANEAGTAAATNGIFRFSLTADAALLAGPQYLVMESSTDYIVYGQVNVDPIALTVTANPAAAIKGVEQDFSFKAVHGTAKTDITEGTRFMLTGVKLEDLVTTDGEAAAPGVEVAQNGRTVFPITNAKATNATVYATLKADKTTFEAANIASIDVVVSDAADHSVVLKPSGEIKVTATSNVGATETDYTAFPEYKGEAIIAVATAANINVLGLPAKLPVIDDVTPVINKTVRVLYGAGQAFDKVTVKAVGANMDWEETFDVSAEDVALQDTVNIVIPFAPEVAGEVVVEITAKKGVSTYSFSKTISVDGYNVTITPGEVLVDEEVDYTITITDVDGKPVNNATATLGGVPVILNTDYRNNGVYVHEALEFDTVGGLDLKVFDADGNVMAYVVDAVEVVGADAYDVTADEDTLLLGQKQKVTFRVQNLEGENVLGLVKEDFSLQVVKEDGTKLGATNPAAITSLGKGEYSFDILVDEAKAVGVNVRVSTNAGKDTGVVEFDVVKPVVSLNTNSVTEGLWQDLTVQVIDPRTDEALLVPFTLVKNSLTAALRDLNEEDIVALTFAAAEETSFQVRAKASDAEEAENYFSFTVKLDAAAEVAAAEQVAVEQMNIAVSHEALVLGQHTTITVTATDHQDNPVVGKDVTVGGQLVGETDENGQISYSLMKNDTAVVAVEVATDLDGVVAKTTVAVGLDAEDPVIAEVPAQVNSDKLTITITDNVKVTRLVINDKEVIIVPRDTVTYTVQLVEGVNTIKVLALDAAGNGVEETFKVTYTKPVVNTGVKFVVGQAGYTSNGQQHDMVAAYKQGSHTMVAVRMLEELGAKFAWNQASRTATFNLNGKVVKVTQDSTTATVDGKVVVMPVAPKNVNGRLMVPVRFISESLGLFVHWQPGDIITIK